METLSPQSLLTFAMATGDAAATVELQERHGQATLVTNTSLPSNMGGQRPIFEAMGITFGQPGDDPMFLPATLPAGWKKAATEHAMYSDLIDDKGRKRALIFYKAAFYDRSANMCAVGRYRVGRIESDPNECVQYGVLDGDKVVWSGEVLPNYSARSSREERLAFYEQSDKRREVAIAWIDANKPEWTDPLAYWNE